MRLLALLALTVAVLVPAAPALADGAPVARLDPAPRAVLAAATDAAATLAPRFTVSARTSISFGFQGPAQPVARLVPPRPIVAPSAFHGFGGFAARIKPVDLQERPLLEVNDVVEYDDVVEQRDVIVEDDVVEGRVDRCGRVYTTRRPAEVTHRSSYYVPTYRRYYSSCGSCCSPCYQPCYRPCHRVVYHQPCGWGGCGYRSCGWGPFWNGLGWGLGVGLGVGVIAGW